MNTSVLIEELAHFQVRIEQTQKKYDELKGELLLVEAELETFSVDRQRFDVLRDVCKALGRLGELKADGLFWEGIADSQGAAGHLDRAKNRIAGFDAEISGILDRQASLREQINRCRDELLYLDDEVRDAYAREERRQEEYLVEREISPVPYHSMSIPGPRALESERRFRRALLTAMLVFFLISTVVLLVELPPPPRPAVAVVPKRLVAMLRRERPKPPPAPLKDEKKPEKEQTKEAKQKQPEPIAPEKQAARAKAESTGVLAFKESFKDLMDETPNARLGAEAQLINRSGASGQARSSRSLISIQSSGGSSGGISNAGVSHNIGSGNGNKIGGVGFTRVQSGLAGLSEEKRPLGDGIGPARTDEEIQIVFDRYKATFYRMYNAELRKNPTLRGKLVLRITIEPAGDVSACTVQSSELASPELVAQIVERVKRFNFGPKENVPKTTILYPIDFLPAG